MPPSRQFAARVVIASSRIWNHKRWSLPSLSDALISLIPNLRPMDHLFGIVAFESAGVPLPGETILVALHSLPPPLSDQHRVVVLAACSGAIVGTVCRIHGRASAWLPFLRRYGRYIRLDEDRLMIVDICFFSMGTPRSLGVSLQCYECLRLCLRAPIAWPPGRFFFSNITGGVCWACLFGFGAYGSGRRNYKLSGTLRVISFGLLLPGDCTPQFHSTK